MSWSPPVFAVLKWRWMRAGTCGHCGEELTPGSGGSCPCPGHHQRYNRTAAPMHPPHDVCHACRFGFRPMRENIIENRNEP